MGGDEEHGKKRQDARLHDGLDPFSALGASASSHKKMQPRIIDHAITLLGITMRQDQDRGAAKDNSKANAATS
jgi:hypothetical protein